MTDPVRALIVDDEAPSRATLRKALAVVPHWTLVAECQSGSEAKNVLETQPVDVLFLDIRMPRETGIALARDLCTLEEPPIVVFVTAYSNFALEAFQVHALDYLLKPMDPKRFRETVERAESLVRLRQQKVYGHALRDYVSGVDDEAQGKAQAPLERFMVRSTGRLDIVPVAEVLWIGSAGNYVELHLEGRTVLHRVAMAKLEGHLDPSQFLRIHRSAFIRRDQALSLAVTGDGTYAMSLRSGDTLPVSPRYVKGVRAFLESC